jgi:predicted DNA-binding protein YlxM (UPF0122 family)
MQKLANYLKISYREEIFKLRPVPVDFNDLRETISDLIPAAPSELIYSYKDDSGDTIKVTNTKSLHSLYLDLDTSPDLILVLSPNFDELLENSKSKVPLRSNEEDIINLIILGVVEINQTLLNSLKYFQTEFSKKITTEIASFVKDSSMEEVAEKFGVSWEVIFYMMHEPLLSKHKSSRKVSYTQIKNVFKPSKCLEIVKDFLAGKVTKEEVLKNNGINDDTFKIWINIFRDPVVRPMAVCHIPNKERVKLISSYLMGKVTIAEIEYAFCVSEEEIRNWAVYFSQETIGYQREKFVSAEEKYDVLNRYFKGEYSVGQFQNDYGIRGNLLYKWIRQLQSGRPLTGSNIFRTSSDELEQAYNIFMGFCNDR